MLIGGVIDHELDHDLHVSVVSGIEEGFEVFNRPITGIDGHVVGNVVAIIPERGREEWQQPQAGHAEVLQIVELLHQPWKVTDAIVVAVHERPDVQFINDRVLIPEGILHASGLLQIVFPSKRFSNTQDEERSPANVRCQRSVEGGLNKCHNST